MSTGLVLELVAQRDAGDLNVVVGPGVDIRHSSAAEWGCSTNKGASAHIGVVELVEEILGADQDIRRCHPFGAPTDHPTCLRRIERCIALDAQASGDEDVGGVFYVGPGHAARSV